MNRPPAEFKRVPVALLRSFTADCLKAAGLRADHADQLAELLSNSDLRGVRSHGTRAMVGYCGGLRDGTCQSQSRLARAPRYRNYGPHRRRRRPGLCADDAGH